MTIQTSTRIATDGIELFQQTWVPAIKAKAVVCLIHGLGEHSSRYMHFFQFLNGHGYIVTALDLRGHGKSGGQRGHSPSYDHMMDDIQAFVESTRDAYPGLPLFLYGHSMGGSLVLNLLLRRPVKVKGAVVSAPGLATGEKVAAWKTTMGKILYNLYPTFSMPNGLDLENLSRDPQVKEKYVADPLVHKLISARFGLDFIASGQWALENAENLSSPILLMYGSKDHLVAGDAIRSFAKKAPGVTYKEWDGFFHEIHNEPEKEQVFDTTLQWLDNRLQ